MRFYIQSMVSLQIKNILHVNIIVWMKIEMYVVLDTGN